MTRERLNWAPGPLLTSASPPLRSPRRTLGARHTLPQPQLPKALEAYFTGPAARGYSPPDLEAQYVVPFNKPPPPYRPPGGGAGQGEQEEPDPNGTHTARAVPPGSAPLALGPPVHSSVQTGHVAAAPTSSPAGAVAGADTVAGGWGAPMDWSHLFGTPAPAVVPSSAAAGGGAGAGASGDKGGAPPGLPVPRSLARMPSQAGSIGGASAAMTAVTGGGVSVLSRRTHNAVTAALPGTAEGKFCGAVVGVMDRLAATSALQAGGGGGGKYRSLRVQVRRGGGGEGGEGVWVGGCGLMEGVRQVQTQVGRELGWEEREGWPCAGDERRGGIGPGARVRGRAGVKIPQRPPHHHTHTHTHTRTHTPLFPLPTDG